MDSGRPCPDLAARPQAKRVLEMFEKDSYLEQFWTPDGLAPDLAIGRMREMLERVLKMLENYTMCNNFGLRRALARKIDDLR